MVHIRKNAEPQTLTQEKRNGVKLYPELDTDGEAASTIEYSNMLGVCQGNSVGGRYKALTCDKHRGNIPLVINPLQKHLVQQIKYKGDGTFIPIIHRSIKI